MLRKRILSILLAGAMLVSNVNVTAYAADTNTNITSPVTQDVTDNAPDTDGAFKAADAQDDIEPSAADADTEDGNDMGETTKESMVVTGTFSISGTVIFNETLSGVSWTDLVRPSEFDQPVRLTRIYTDSKGETHTDVLDTQDDIAKNDMYLKFVHDGSGAGDFTIENVPKSVTDAYGVECQVTSYFVNVEPSFDYYEAGEPVSVELEDPEGISSVTGTLTLSLVSETLNIAPNVTPEGSADGQAFETAVTFKNPLLAGGDYDSRSLSQTYYPTGNTPVAVKVPAGISYSLTQKTPDGFKTDGVYTTTVTAEKEGEEKKEDTTTGTGKAEGQMVKDSTVTVSTSYVAQNVTAGFDVVWVDMGSTARPGLGKDNFTLQYKTADGEWTDLTSDAYEALGIEDGKEPAFDASGAENGNYAYTGLPAVDAKGNGLFFQVVLKNCPDGYHADVTDNENTSRRCFTFTETISYEASIKWNDKDDTTNRPENIESLKLYRRVGNGAYELVYDTIPEDAITKGDTSWSIGLSSLPRYNASCQEYDYVLAEGTIITADNGTYTVAEEAPAHYKTYYANGTGSYGNDILLCHNGGSMTQVRYDFVDFSATKEWKDPEGTQSTRPKATVTLWRYIKGTADSIDDAYENSKAAQVIFQTMDADGNVKENILSYTLDNADTSDISFDLENISSLPANFSLPAYDDQGREYIYFVRETLSGDGSDEYTTTYRYTDENGESVTAKNGAPTDGTIINTKRKKGAVTISKIWQNHSGLEDIEGVTVTMEIRASADGGETYDKLTVYKEGSFKELTGEKKQAAQTTDAFPSGTSQADITYYVNTYDEEGKPYDMSSAIITETVTAKDGSIWRSVRKDGVTTVTDADRNSYIEKTTYTSETSLAGGTQQYRYTQTNTITAEREYKLIKEWADSITDEEVESIAYVSFRLERRTTKDNADGTQASYEHLRAEDGTYMWKVSPDGTDLSHSWESVLSGLPRYDSEGYEYYYRATEASITDKDGNTYTTGQMSEEKGWSVNHYRNTDQTRAVNYVHTKGRGYFTITKTWKDNGDLTDAGSARKKVTYRVYSKKALKEALEGLDVKDTDIVALDGLDVKYYSGTLTSDNDNTAYVYFSDLADATEEEGNSISDYVILEYSVGRPLLDGARAASYAYKELYVAATGEDTENLTGTVENNTRQYNTNIIVTENKTEDGSMDAGNVSISNTRTGKSSVTVTKTWKDSNNYSGLRDTSISFQLYRDGSAYTDIPEGVTITAEKETEKDTCKVSLERMTGIVTVSSADDKNTAGTWKLSITDLDMFSATGTPYSYSVEELAGEEAGEDEDTVRTYTYTSKLSGTSVTSSTKTCTYAFTFENTLSGTTSHTAYKYWQDAGIGASNRPDLYLTLYRYLTKEAKENPDADVEDLSSYEAYAEGKDQEWTPETENPDGSEYCTGYNWKIKATDLPLFDEEGNEYTYVFKESMNNNGKTVLGTYKSEVQEKETEDKSNKDNYEIFTNTITSYMLVSGKKTWTGLSGYGTALSELPDPEIILYRTTDASITSLQDMTGAQVQALVDAGIITLVDTTHLSGSTTGTNDKTRYSFPDSDVTKEELEAGLICKMTSGDGISYKLPKFDSTGNRYTYLVREEISDTIAGQLYSEMNDNGTLSNTFRSDINRRKITVTKNWNRGSLATGEDKYPSVTVSLYRYKKGTAERTVTADATLIATHTFAASEFNTAGDASYTFEDLLVYAPSGEQYCYYITEKSINGYSVKYTDEEAVENTTAAGYSEDELNALKSNDRIDVVSIPEKWNDPLATDNDLTTAVSLTNTYDQPGTVTISGEKAWDDVLNLEGIRPESINVTLTRRTNNESGQDNKVETIALDLPIKTEKDETCTTPYIVWDYGDNALTSQKWSYKIYNLARYAANGMPYIYTLSEAQVAGYKKAADVSVLSDSSVVTMSTLKNSYSGTYYVRKNWMDGNNKYALRPESITVKLQRSSDNGATWSDIILKDSQVGTCNEKTGVWTGYPSVTTDGNGSKILSVTLDKRYVLKNTKNNSWDYIFTNLPTQDANGNTYTYRCIETAIGGVPLEENTADDGSVRYSAGAYECKYATQDATKTVLENTLDATSLMVTKVWEDDSDDLYASRPDSLTFVLQKRSVMVDADGTEGELGDWETVTNEDGSDYTFTISKTDNWTKTLEDLPTAEVLAGEDKTYTAYSLYFRAVEVHADDKTSGDKTSYATGTAAKGAENYEDTTDYSLESPDHTYDAVLGRNESTITNRLVTDDASKDITVTKIWRRSEGSELTAEFELQCKTADESTWHSYKNGGIKQSVASTKDGTETVSFLELPKYDRSGKELYYQVTEKAIDGYKTDVTTKTAKGSAYATSYTFINTQLQDYTVEKTWENTADAATDDNGTYTAVFKLQMKTDGQWRDVTEKDAEGYEDITLTTGKVNGSASGTWTGLPMYTAAEDGSQSAITYRAVETKINGNTVTNDTDGNYAASYTYTGADDKAHTKPAFKDTVTSVTNRMVYGFVNMSKAAAYLNNNTGSTDITDTDTALSGVSFDIYKKGSLLSEDTLYVSGVKTDENGNLINSNGAYGEEGKYLVPGTYVLKETSTNQDYSVWDKGIAFTIGVSGNGNTGEHGTAWVSTKTGAITGSITLNVEYLTSEAPAAGHAFSDGKDGLCVAQSGDGNAVNLESRGVVAFYKTDKNGDGNSLDIHEGATGEEYTYFGIYLDKNCTEQVAGAAPVWVSTGYTGDSLYYREMTLTNKAKDGTMLNAVSNSNGVAYLRGYRTNDSSSFYRYTLLSGTYYIREERAPAGYRLDTTIRKLVVNKLAATALDTDLGSAYNNPAEIMGINETTGDKLYKWENEKNSVTLYKLDQFGRQVALKDTESYLEIKAENNTFPHGAEVIRLYQDSENPAVGVLSDGSTVSMADYITYAVDDNGRGYWTADGLFEAGKAYTVSEPEESVGENYVVAEDISFTMRADGKLAVTGAESKDDPLAADGTAYGNIYKAGENGNTMVLRDVSRYLKDIAVEKTDSVTGDPVEYISFKLYKQAGEEKVSVLEDGTYLTTDENGKIELGSLDTGVKNMITGSSLKYGLDIGTYYLEEIERGVSDGYRLIGTVTFTITPNGKGSAADYNDYANVTYDTTSDPSHVEQKDDRTVLIKNDPVESTKRTLNLFKTGTDMAELTDVTDIHYTGLSGAEFALAYKSLTHGEDGSATGGNVTETTITCITGDDGYLYVTDGKGNFKTDENGNKTKPDISMKGSYRLVETKAPDYYMTPTDENGNLITLLSFDVDSENNITNVTCSDRETNMEYRFIKEDMTENEDGSVSLNAVVYNEPAYVSFTKLDDLVSSKKTCDQTDLNGNVLIYDDAVIGASFEIYEGTSKTGTLIGTLNATSDGWIMTCKKNGSEQTSSAINFNNESILLPAGSLKENTVYTLHEATAPVGYLPADDVAFKLFGTTTKTYSATVIPTSFTHKYNEDGTITVTVTANVSTLYVWTGSGTPDVEADGWSSTANIKDNSIAMVDEAVIAPVDVQKVTGPDDNGDYKILSGSEFSISTADGTFLGTAVSGSDGYLTWKEISSKEAEGAGTGLIFDETGTRISKDNTSTLTGKRIILQQTTSGYMMTETYAPDEAYNEGKSLTFHISAANYLAYKTESVIKGQTLKGYDTTAYVDIKDADGSLGNTVTELSHRDAKATKGDLVNPSFEAMFYLYKYDAEDADINNAHDNYSDIGMEGVTFTLYKKQSDGTYKKVKDEKTGENGLLALKITEKGTYQLKETKTLAGYELDSSTVYEFTVTNDDYRQDLTYSETTENKTEKVTVTKDADDNVTDVAGAIDMANTRIHGSMTLAKVDADNDSIKLDGVRYVITRISPDKNTLVDNYYPALDTDGNDTGLTVETGKAYGNVAGAKSADEVAVVDAESGVLTVSDLQWGTYKVVEVKENDGYVISSDAFTFTIGAENRDVTVAESNGTYVLNAKNKVTVKKVSSKDTDKTLSGAKFVLYPVTDTDGELTVMDKTATFYKSADAGSKEGSTITAGETTIYGLTKGTYLLREAKAPDGYELAQDVVFTMSADGTVSDVTTCTVSDGNVVTKDADGSAAVTVSNDGTHAGSGKENTLTVQDVPIEIYIEKLGEENNAILTGAVFTLTDTCADDTCSHVLADGKSKKADIHVDDTDAASLIPIETVIGGHTYTLTETKAPDGYEATAVVTFTVKTDGTIENISSFGGYEKDSAACATLDADKTTVSIQDEEIRTTLTKVDASDPDTALAGVGFKLTPYGDSSFADGSKASVSYTTNENGQISFPDRLLKHDNEYLLQETDTISGYYLQKELSDGVILKVGKDGNITVKRLAAYDGLTLTGTDASSCPVSAAVDADGKSHITVTNMESSSFTLTKKVEGNMGDLNGAFKLNIKAYEPDGTLIGERNISLKADETYDSETGKDGDTSNAFGMGALPVGAVLKITEDNGVVYTAIVKVKGTDGVYTETDRKETTGDALSVTLTTHDKVEIELVNSKEATLDVGVSTERQAPLAMLVLAIPLVWLAVRRKRRWR